MPDYRYSQRQPRAPDGENPYWVSFSDIMAGLLVIFILSLVALMIQLHEQTTRKKELQERIEQALAALARIESERETILTEIKSDLRDAGIEVTVADNGSVLRIPDRQIAFKPGEFAVPADQGVTVAQLGNVLLEAIRSKDRNQNISTIFIEGHTDSVPFNRSELGNWGLSANRAIAVWKYWTEDPGTAAKLLDLKNKAGKPLFSVSGYADTRRVRSVEETKEDFRANRRIDIRFTMRATESSDLKKLIEDLKNEGD